MVLVKCRKEKVDYAAAADAMAESDDEEVAPVAKENENGASSEDDDESDEDDDSESGESDDEESIEEDEATKTKESESNRIAASIKGEGEEPCSFDLRNLLAMNAHTLDTARLYKKPSQDPASSTIPPAIAMNEEYLLEKAQKGCQQILEALRKLPSDTSTDVGTLVTLPTFEDSQVPRALPLPKPRSDTKWEKFARAKGIGMNQSKRSRKVWDEATQSWKFRTGYQKADTSRDSDAKNSTKNWPILEANPEDPYANPWQAQREAHKERVHTNTQQRLKNLERAGGIAKGSAARVLAKPAAPTGVPVDLRPSGRKGNADVVAVSQQEQQRGKMSTLAALKATQRSTASLGKFDKIREGEPERRLDKGSVKKKKTTNMDEHARSLKMLQSMSRSGTEKARKQGRLAHGETAYDYDFEDGLGPSTFRKRKGRAGAGKMKKMTKKRAK